MTAQIALLDFRQHLLDIRSGKLKLRGSTESLEFLAYITERFLALGGAQGLAYPLGNGHASRAGNPLDITVIRVL